MTTASGLNSPGSVAVDNDGRIFVSDTDDNRILEWEPAPTSGQAANLVLGQTSFTTSGAATSANGLDRPAGIWADGPGRLWVADELNNRILRFDYATVAALLPLAPSCRPLRYTPAWLN